MKATHLFTRLSLMLMIFFATQTTFGQSADAKNPATGIWLGALQVPGAELRLAVTITEKADGTVGALLRSIDQSPDDIPFETVLVIDDSIKLSISGIGLAINGKIEAGGQTFSTQFCQGGFQTPLVFKRVEAIPGFNRPQELKKPYPYLEEQVEYENAQAGIKLAGTLTLPSLGGPFAAAILLTGSGQQNRDEEIFGHKPFLVLADYLTRQGFAVLRVDDRGVGGSTGDPRTSTSGDFAQDALAGIAFLKTRQEINPKQIGLIGHSEGGMIAPIAAAASPDVAFIVMLAGPGVGFGDIVIHQRLQMFQATGMGEENLARQKAWYQKLYAICGEDIDNAAAEKKIRETFAQLPDAEKQALTWNDERLENELPGLLAPWWRYAMAYDPAKTLGQVKCPVLAIIGEKDTQVPAKDNLPEIEKALTASDHKNFKVQEMPGLNHLFQTAQSGSEMEYSRIEETFAPVALELVADWLKANTGK